MISDGLRVWQHYPHLLAAPAAVLGLATVAFSFLGDGLNDALNPRGVEMNARASSTSANLTIDIDTRNGPARVVDGIDLHVDKGETLGIVGEMRLRQEPHHAVACSGSCRNKIA